MSKDRYISAKTILSKYQNAPDKWFGITYNMNLYRGCQHQCIYCDSRSECYQLGDLADIRIKENALQILERELKTKRKRATVGFGSMNDPYMPVEVNEQLVRGALKLLVRYNYPVHMLTKSDLILRDIDLLKELSIKYAAASFTITTANDELSKMIEPGAPVSSKRFAAISKLASEGIYTGVMYMPLLPFINDTWEEVEKTIVLSKEAGAKYLLFWPGLSLRKGSREYFYQKLDKLFPGIKQKYIDTFGENYICNSPNADELYRKASLLQKEIGLPQKMEFCKEDMLEQFRLEF
ncbi:MAG: radical SAM protein [Prolixibacteraceae bacterium]|nr:radical SAM protein [Prolixibacteraceae bacterium]